MLDSSPQEITQLLRAWGNGDQAALEQLAPLVHERLRRIAHGYLRRERSAHVLQSSALVNEAYLRLLTAPPVDWQDRQHFFATMARAMRRILVDFVRGHDHRIEAKDRQRVGLEDAMAEARRRDSRLVAIDEALKSFEKIYPRRGLVIELGFFGGLTQGEIAQAIGFTRTRSGAIGDSHSPGCGGRCKERIMKPSGSRAMSPEQRESVYELFQQTADAAPDARLRILATTLDETVRVEVLGLLDSHDRRDGDDLLAEPAMVEAARLLAEDPDPLFTGQQLGRYKILAALGRGGMGCVYQALDDMGRQVAIKVSLSDDEEWRNRFEREARTQAQLNHPNIATIHSREEIDGLRFLVLEYVPGETLAARLMRQRRMPREEAAKIFSQIADALDFIHRAGRIHRDLKPSNVMITPAGRVKLLDFGISKRLAAAATPEAPAASQADQPAASFNEWLTRHAGVLGTLPFMSPEQLRGAPIDERADLWAFGVMLYESLAGRHPFARTTAEATRAAILAASPDWKALPAKTPAAARTLLRLCLEGDPAARLREAAEAGRLLTHGATASPWPLLRNSINRRAPLLALLVVLTLVAGMLLVIRQRTPIGTQSAKRLTLTVTYAQDNATSGACQPGQRSEVIAGVLMNRLKTNPQLAVYLPRLMPKSLPAQAGLAQAFDSDWTLRIDAQCATGKFAIGYDLVGRGLPDQHGEAQNLEELQASVLGKIGVSPEQISLSEDEQAYRNAIELLNQPFNQTAIKSAIQSLKKLHDVNSSQPHVNAALAKAYWYEYAITARGGAAAQSAGQTRKQIRELCQMNQQFLGNSDRDAEAIANCAFVFVGLGDYDQAIRDWEALIQRGKNDSEISKSLAYAYEQRGRDYARKADFNAAERDFNLAKDYYLKAWAERKDWSTAIEIGGFYFEQGNYAEAITYWEKAREQLPNEPFNLSNLGSAYLRLGQIGRALDEHRKASREDDPLSLFNYGAALILTGNCDQAASIFERGKDIVVARNQEPAPELRWFCRRLPLCAATFA